MSYTVHLTDTAKQDLREIAFRIAEQTKETLTAGRFIGELRDKCKKPEVFPSSGAIPKDRVLKSLGYRYIVHKDYLIFYLINDRENRVDIMAIFNAKKDYMRVIRRFI